MFGLEFDEKSILEKENNLHIVNALKEAGFKIILDNFGSGYSSFYMFEELEPHALKINLKDINTEIGDKKGNVIIHSMVKLAEKINTMLIFKSVDTKQDFDLLKKMKCKYFQGKYFFNEKEENTL
jgi:EAL domain-containing protein (putative c-di-GMP-specific phosphodiesterase class I)